MAGGVGARMRSSVPKHLHPLLGRRLLDWAVGSVRALEPARCIVVCSPDIRDAVARGLPQGVDVAVQARPRGTGDAVAAARPALDGFDGDLLVVPGDLPLLPPALLRRLLDTHTRARPAVTLLSLETEKPLPYGRVVRDESGAVRGIVEERDASRDELAIRELNASVYVFSAPDLWWALARLDVDNAQGELYLTDTVRHLVSDGKEVAVEKTSDVDAAEGVNTRVELADAARVLRDRIVERHMLAGVTVTDPATTWIDDEVEIEADAVVHPFTILRGRTVVRAGAQIGPHAVIEDSEIGPGGSVGPFAYLRPGASLAAGSKVGTFVEVKNSRIGERTKVPHLSYIGDAEIGEDTNIGAGAITANYRPESHEGKQRTVIGRNVHTGSDNVFVAPVEIGDDAWIGAGSTITEDVPPGALAIARARQVVKENYGGERND
jgi:bifunctional UDP-N-acetylglucosamine pyrophosphorylase/glucosamine-1-phosphate N-acetyltransferase